MQNLRSENEFYLQSVAHTPVASDWFHTWPHFEKEAKERQLRNGQSVSIASYCNYTRNARAKVCDAMSK